MLTRKDYQSIAKILRDTDASPETVNAFMEWFKEDNIRFNKERFTAALAEVVKDG